MKHGNGAPDTPLHTHPLVDFKPILGLDDREDALSRYILGKAPADLASACLELAVWNMTRYRGPPPRSGFLIGMTGNVRGNGRDGEHLEASMPENVRHFLESYKRRVI
jgi:hypothetical protein